MESVPLKTSYSSPANGKQIDQKRAPLFKETTLIERGSTESEIPSQSTHRKRSLSLSISTRQAHGLGDDDGLSNWQVFAHLVKASVGTGVLSMSSATKDAGVLVGPLGIFFVAIVIIHSMQLLVRTTQFLRRYYDLTECDLDYADTVAGTIRFGFNNDSKLMWLATYLQACLITSQTGFLAVFVIFVSENTKYMVDHYDLDYKPPLIIYQLSCWVLLIPLVFVKTLNKLSFLSTIANVFGFIALAIVIIYCLMNLKPVTDLPLAKDFDTIPLFFGVVAFGFESINVLLPVENKMIKKDCMLGFGGVLNLAMVCVVCLYTAVAFYGYLSFGEGIGGSITYSMPMEPWYFMISKPMYALSIFISYALQFYILFVILWNSLVPRLKSARALFWGDALLRIGIVTVTVVLATAVPHVEHMISLIGAFSGSSLTMIFPALLDSIIVWKEYENKVLRRIVIAKNIGIICIGLIGAVIGTVTSINVIIKAFQEG